MKGKVIITDHLHQCLPEILIDAGFQVDVFADITNRHLKEVISNYDGLVVGTKIKVIRDLIDEAGKLKFIARAGSGMDNIDVEYAS